MHRMPTHTVERLLLALLLLGLAGSAAADRKVLIVGIDGTRPDALEQVLQSEPAPGGSRNWLDRLRGPGHRGGASFGMITGDISFSGPGWASMLTGVWCDRHRVLSNEFVAPNFEDHPPIFALMKAHDPGIRTASIANWDAINEKILTKEMTDEHMDQSSDDMVESMAVSALLSPAFDADAVFLHFDDVDHAGHACCYSTQNENYMNAIRRTAQRLQVIRAALKTRTEMMEDEQWLVLYSTDHGGGAVIGSEHGTNTDGDRLTFLLAEAYGAAIDLAQPPEGARLKIVDIAATALDWMNVPVPEYFAGQNVVIARGGGDLPPYEERPIPECGFPRAVWDQGKGPAATLLQDKALPVH